MKKLIVLIVLFVSVKNYSQEYTLLHINSSWNSKNDYKDLNKLKGVRIVKAFYEDQNQTIKSQIKSLPVIFIYKDRHLIGRWDAGISMQIKNSYIELQDVIDDSKSLRRATSTE